jgi:hypothetical protein
MFFGIQLVFKNFPLENLKKIDYDFVLYILAVLFWEEKKIATTGNRTMNPRLSKP